MNIIKHIQDQLIKIGVQSPQLFYVACWLAEKITGRSVSQLLTVDSELTDAERKQLENYIHDLTVLKKPLQYVLGTVDFCGLELTVRPPVLIPRPETEEWVTALIKQLEHEHKPLKILDIGTGTGCIALALAHALPQAQVIGVDCSQEALNLARENQIKLAITNVTFIESDIFSNIKETFDVIISNPPYIAEHEWQQLEDTVRVWEDKGALVADNQGLMLLKQIIEQAPTYLNQHGKLVLEMGSLQGDAVCTLMRSCGYTDVELYKDFAGLDRLVIGYWEGM